LGSFARITAIEALCVRRGLAEDIRKDIGEIKRKMKNCQDRRNRILHDPWYVGKAEVAQFKSMPRDEFEVGFKPVTEAYLVETLEKIERRIDELQKLRARIRVRL
jgi:hypothetical protein